MPIEYGPRIVTDGLVLALDAADINSFDEYENLVLQTSQIGVTPTYSASGIVGVNTTATTAPNGLYEASTLDNNGNTSANYVFGGAAVGLTTNTTYTYSIHIKQGTKPDFQITIDENGFGGKRYYSSFTYSNESVTTGVSGNTGNDGVVVGSTATKLTNGWYRLSLTFRTSTTAASGFVDMINRFGNTSGSNYVWGRQLELGSTANNYYATTGTAKTRGSTWIDLSGNSNNGTLTNGPTYSIDNGGSIVFDGTNDYVNLGNILNIGTGQFSIECIARISSLATANFSKVASKGVYNENGWRLRMNKTASNVYRIALEYDPTSVITILNPIQPDTWYHFLVCRDSSNLMSTYANGVLTSTTTITSDLTNSNYNYIIGDSGALLEPFNGNVACYRHYNRALTATEVQQNFNALRGRFGI